MVTDAASPFLAAAENERAKANTGLCEDEERESKWVRHRKQGKITKEAHAARFHGKMEDSHEPQAQATSSQASPTKNVQGSKTSQ